MTPTRSADPHGGGVRPVEDEIELGVMQASTFCQRRLEPMEHTARRTRVRVQRYRLANRLDHDRPARSEVVGNAVVTRATEL